MTSIVVALVGVALIAVALSIWLTYSLATLRHERERVEQAIGERDEFSRRHQRCDADLAQLRSRFSHVLDVEGEAQRARADAEKQRTDADRLLSEINTKIAATTQMHLALLADEEQRRSQLESEYGNARARYEQLKIEISAVEERLEDISVGIYEPHFNFDSPERYKAALEALRIRERQISRAGQAVICEQQWTVNNDHRVGERMVTLNKKLALRAFNGECEAALADVSWSNLGKMEQRIAKALETINKLGEVLLVRITNQYFELRVEELQLKYEFEEKRHRDREEMRRVREQIREEERVQREFEEARRQAEADEARYRQAMDRAKQDAEVAGGKQLERILEKVSSFEAKLDEARARKERAIARAQITKSGFVYVISNIGSFGERVYKIGMTRRLEPMDRIYELSSASVPFPFDLHAMLYSDNAPELEYSLHKLFENRRLNLANPRREFYRDVELDEVEQFVRTKGLSAQFIKIPEAREYRETLVRQQNLGSKPTQSNDMDVYTDVLFPKIEISGRPQTILP